MRVPHGLRGTQYLKPSCMVLCAHRLHGYNSLRFGGWLRVQVRTDLDGAYARQ